MKTIFLLLALATAAQAQTLTDPKESNFGSDFRREREHFSEACGTFSLKSTAGCAIELFTDHPFHIAAGSIAPQNGFGVGGAVVTHYTPTNWRMSLNLDAVGSSNASWRAGVYLKMVHTPVEQSGAAPSKPGEPAPKHITIKVASVHPYTVFNLYAQAISLNQLNFFGLGPDSTVAGKSLFGMTQSIAGISAIKPIYEWKAIRGLNLSLLGQANARFVSIRSRNGQSSPSIETLYSGATAPGLTNQPGFLQLEEGIRLKPSLFSNNLQFNYLANFQEFFAPSSSQYNFQRWTLDLNHSILLHTHTQSYASKDAKGPDDCTDVTATKDTPCPPVSYSWNLQGSINFRFLLSESLNSSSAAVPFYFQQTLGGSGINGAPALSSFQDYRFRGPNLMLFRESFEHSLWGPFGFQFLADQGKVALTRGDIGFDHLKHSFAAGLTLRAGGFPQVSLLYAWGGESSHTIGALNTSLLGGSGRPPLD
jgi:hypothetical protein